MSVSVPRDEWPQVMARWYRDNVADAPRAVRVIVMHTMEVAEKAGTARMIAHDFATRSEDAKASAHCCVDDADIIECVDANDIAYCAPGANADGIHIEMAGTFRQNAAQWTDAFSIATLDRAADAAAQYALEYGVPARHLSDDELRAGERGFVGHSQVSDVYKKEARPSEHRDPGEAFPWDAFLASVQQRVLARAAAHGVVVP